jgi:hypothetical protein
MEPLPIESILQVNPHLDDVLEKTIVFKPLATPFVNQATLKLPSLPRNAFWTHLYVKLIDYEQGVHDGNVLVGAHWTLGLFPPLPLTAHPLTDRWVPLAFPLPTRPLRHHTLHVEVHSREPFEGFLVLRALAVEDLFDDKLDDHLYVDESGMVQFQITYGPEGDGGVLYERRNQQELLQGAPERRIHSAGVL